MWSKIDGCHLHSQHKVAVDAVILEDRSWIEFKLKSANKF